VLVYITRRLRAQINQKNTPNIADNLDAGEVINVHDWVDGVGHTHYRGTQWRVLLDTPDNAPLSDGSYRIVKLDGVHIRVARLNPINPH
jgi:membrane protein implicated in regulation of membrane protease activity